jgi:hypothetical protein
MATENTCKVCKAPIPPERDTAQAIADAMGAHEAIDRLTEAHAYGFCSEACEATDDERRTIEARTRGIVR